MYNILCIKNVNSVIQFCLLGSPFKQQEQKCEITLLIFASISNRDVTSNVVININMPRILYLYVDVVSKSNVISTLLATAITFAGNIDCTVLAEGKK